MPCAASGRTVNWAKTSVSREELLENTRIVLSVRLGKYVRDCEVKHKRNQYVDLVSTTGVFDRVTQSPTFQKRDRDSSSARYISADLH